MLRPFLVDYFLSFPAFCKQNWNRMTIQSICKQTRPIPNIFTIPVIIENSQAYIYEGKQFQKNKKCSEKKKS